MGKLNGPHNGVGNGNASNRHNPAVAGGGGGNGVGRSGFTVPLHYPRYAKKDYEEMPEWRLDLLLQQYGLPLNGDVAYKRRFAMGAFLWPDDSGNPKASK